MRAPRFKNPSMMPPGGYQFRQIEIGWRAPNPMSEGLDVLVDRVWNLRMNNPVLVRLQLPTDKRLIRDEIIAFNCAMHPNACVDQEAAARSLQPASRTSHVERHVGCCGG
jgi:hypothetical protein